MAALPTQKFIDIDPSMIIEIAHGVDDPTAIAARYGLGESEWSHLCKHPPFVLQVDEKKRELQASGYSFRMKAAIAAELILTEVTQKALEHGASFATQLDALKFTSKAGGIDQPAREGQQAGSGFSISIHLGNGNSVEINGSGNQEHVIEPDDVGDLTEFGAVPSYLAYQPGNLYLQEESHEVD